MISLPARNILKHQRKLFSPSFVSAHLTSKALPQRFYSTEAAETKPKSKPKVAVVFAGCGFLDGSDTIEGVSTIINLSEQGITPAFFAPTEEIDTTWNHNTREKDPREERYMNKESARITRGQIKDLDKLRAADFDAVILVGGYGWVRNVSNIEHEREAEDVTIIPSVEKAIQDFHKSRKIIASTSFAGVTVAQVLGNGVTVNAGKESTLSEKIKQVGGVSEEPNNPDQVVVDSANNILSVGAYGTNANMGPNGAFQAVRQLVVQVVDSFNKKQ